MFFSGRSPKFLKVLLIGILSCWLTLVGGSASVAQLPAPDLGTTTSQSPPPNVRRIGNLEATPVTIQGRRLFEIASEAVIDRTEPGAQIPVEVRAQRIQESLRYMISLTGFSLFDRELSYSTIYDPETLQISVSVLNDEPVLLATDAQRTEPQVLMTVTDTDAEHNGIPQQELAKRWRDRLQTVLVEELQSRQPQAIWRWVRFSSGILLALAAFSVLCWAIQRQLSTRQETLKARQQDESPDRQASDTHPAEVDMAWQLELLEALQQYLDLDQRVRWLDFFRWLLLWLQISAWISGIALIVDELPLVQTTARDVLLSPLLIFFVWGAAGFVNRLADLAINRVATLWRTRDLQTDVQRRSLRITTLANVLKGLCTFLIYLIAVLYVLELLGFSTRSVLAFGAILGFAVSLASQNLIRDLVNGFLILLEDQFAIGDVIAVDGAAGFVENLNLRTTHLRNGEGRLIVMPNSLINRVENLTRTWARVDHTIQVAVETDPHQALALMRQVAEELYTDPQWRPLMVEPPEVLGIDDISHEGILIRTWIKTQPLKQWAVGREFRLRLKTALDEHNIGIGMPQQRLSTLPSASRTHHSNKALSSRTSQPQEQDPSDVPPR